MLITVDAGNTNITLGVFKEKKVYATFRMTTQMARTSDEYGVLIAEMLGRKGISPKDIEAVIISSVVPKIMYSLTNGIYKYIGLHPIVIEAGTKTGIKIQRANPREVGTDRIVDAVGAYELYGGPCIVIDFGTATTYDLITKDGTFAAGTRARSGSWWSRSVCSGDDLSCRSRTHDDCGCGYSAAYEYQSSASGLAFYIGNEQGGNLGETFPGY